jgi:hypothetical protein
MPISQVTSGTPLNGDFKATRHNPNVGIMRHFMGEGGVVAFAVAKRRQLRHLHEVAAGL